MSGTTFTAAYEKLFGKIEKNLKQFTVSDKVAGREAHNALVRNGGKQYQYTSYAEGYSRTNTQYTDATIDTFTAVGLNMDLDQETTYTFNLDEWDKAKYAGSMEFLQNRYINAMKTLKRDQDSAFFYQYSNATNYFDNANIGGSAGSITFDSSNALQVMSEAQALVQQITGDTQNLWVGVTPKPAAIMNQTKVFNGFNVSDSILANGYLGKDFMGLNYYLSSNLTHEVTLTYTNGTDFTAATTLAIDGITLTAQTTIGTAAGNFLAGTNADTSATALVGLINAPATTSANQVALSSINQAKFRAYVASVDTTADTITIKKKWGPFTSIVSTLTGAVATKIGNGACSAQTVHNVMGEMGCIELANPMGIKNFVRQEPKQLTDNYISATQFGVQTPTINKDRFIDLRMFA